MNNNEMEKELLENGFTAKDINHMKKSSVVVLRMVIPKKHYIP